MATIQEVYIALFGRPADPIGYNYYVEATDDGANLDAVGDLSNSPEYLDRFEGMSNIQKVNAIYQDLFGRPADAAGLTFYVGLLNSGAATEQSIAIQILDGATGDDATIIENKVAAAQLFTDSLDTGDEIADYDGAEAAAAGRAYLDGVGLDEDSIPTQEEVDAAIAALDGVSTIGDTFTLTDEADDLVGTAEDDLFQGTEANLTAFDSIDGGDGDDTLNLIVDGDLDVAAGVSIENVETVNLVRTGAAATTAIDADDFGDAAQAIWQIDAAGDIENLDDGQTAGFQDVSLGNDVGDPTDGTDNTAAQVITAGFLGAAASIALDGVSFAGESGVDAGATGADADIAVAATAGAITINGDDNDAATADDVETLDLSGSVENDVVVVNDGGDDVTISTINLSMTSDVDFSGSVIGADLATFDASGTTGDVDVILTAATAIESVATGSGSDDVTVALGTEDLTVDLGAGNDIVRLDGGNTAVADEAQSATVALGAGNDTFVLTAGGNLADASTSDEEIEASLVSVTDFTAGEDTLDLGFGFAAFDAQGGATGVNAAVEDADTLAEAIAALRADATNNTSQFVFDGNVYVYAETGGNDTLIELTGVTTLLTDADVA